MTLTTVVLEPLRVGERRKGADRRRPRPIEALAPRVIGGRSQPTNPRNRSALSLTAKAAPTAERSAYNQPQEDRNAEDRVG
jgi:hypothetical protein